MTGTTDLNVRRRMATGMRELLSGPARYYQCRLECLDAVIDEIDEQQAGQ